MKKKTILGILVALVLGFWAVTSPSSPVAPYSPLAPHAPNRPVLKFLSRIAKLGLWVMMVAGEEPPKQDEQYARQMVDHNGVPVIDHGRGW